MNDYIYINDNENYNPNRLILFKVLISETLMGYKDFLIQNIIFRELP